MVENFHVESTSTPGHLPAHAAHADDSENTLVDVHSEKQARVVVRELLAAGEMVADHHVPRGGQKKRHGKIGRRTIHRPGRVSDSDPTFSGRRDVNVVDANAKVAHHLQRRESVHQLTVDHEVAVSEKTDDSTTARFGKIQNLAQRLDLANRLHELQDRRGKRGVKEHERSGHHGSVNAPFRG